MNWLSFRLILAVLLAHCLSAQQTPALRLRGFVTDSKTRLPVANAVVSVAGGQARHYATTDTKGFFRLELYEGIKAGESVRIHIEKPGYDPYDETTPASEDVALSINISPSGVNLRQPRPSADSSGRAGQSKKAPPVYETGPGPNSSMKISDNISVVVTRGNPNTGAKMADFSTTGAGEYEVDLLGVTPEKLAFDPPGITVSRGKLPAELKLDKHKAITIVRFTDNGFVIDDHRWPDIRISVALISGTELPPISKTDMFSTLVPFHAEWKDSPIPMDTNFSDPHYEFYEDLMALASRPEQRPDGWPPYKDRRFESADEQFAFVARLTQFYVFRSIDRLQRGVAGGVKWTAGVGVTPIDRKAIVPPDAVPYPTKDLLDTLAGCEFLRPSDQMIWKASPMKLPAESHAIFTEHADPAKGEVFTSTVRLERPGYFKIDFEVRPGIAMNNQLPAGFSSDAVKGTATHSVTVTMRYEIRRRNDGGFQPNMYAAWADSLFSGLRKQMGFDSN